MAPVLENQQSSLLSNEENLQVFKLLGNRCQSLSTAVVQLFQTQSPYHSQWVKKNTGVLCFVKDNTKRNFFFRLYCLKRNSKVWEHEMYNDMEYVEGTPFFHIFEGNDCLVAFNFASVEEARDLKYMVNQKVLARKRREEKHNRQQSTHSQTLPSPKAHVQDVGHNFAFKKTLDPVAKRNKRRRNITKADIGCPSDFKHVSHISWNSTFGFDIDTEDEQLKAFFKKAGVSEHQLRDKHTRAYIYDFIEKHGGREAVVNTATASAATSMKPATPAQDVAPPAVPPRGSGGGNQQQQHLRGGSGGSTTHFRNAPPPPVPGGKAPPPPVPGGGTKLAVAPPPPAPPSSRQPPNRPQAPPPSKRPPPIPSTHPPPSGQAPAPPPPPPPPGVPPPPPPPPADDAPPPPLPTSMPPSLNSSGLSSELMQSIRNGTTLRSAADRDDARPSPKQPEDARGLLLDEIRRGCKLKPVDKEAKSPSGSTNATLQQTAGTPNKGSIGDNLAFALARALAERSKAIHSEDDDDDSDARSDTDDDEWED
nr:unnamed protein product [Callosobruchus chinensis]